MPRDGASIVTRPGQRLKQVGADRKIKSQRLAKLQGRTMSRHTLIHLSLSQQVVDDVDTLLWLRVTAADLDMEAIRKRAGWAH